MQRVLEQRVTALLDKLLVKPSLVNPPPMEEGGLLLVSRITKCVSIPLSFLSEVYFKLTGIIDQRGVAVFENAGSGL